MTRPGHYACGSGSEINCEHWDPVNGCWKDQDNIEGCPYYNQFLENEDEKEY